MNDGRVSTTLRRRSTRSSKRRPVAKADEAAGQRSPAAVEPVERGHPSRARRAGRSKGRGRRRRSRRVAARQGHRAALDPGPPARPLWRARDPHRARARPARAQVRRVAKRFLQRLSRSLTGFTTRAMPGPGVRQAHCGGALSVWRQRLTTIERPRCLDCRHKMASRLHSVLASEPVAGALGASRREPGPPETGRNV